MPNKMSNEQLANKKYDLEERTAKFGEDVIDFVKDIQKIEIAKSIANQLIRSATSIGANYCEADCAETKKDFEHKLGICNKEAKETQHWLRMLARVIPEKAAKARLLWKEVHELHLIFVTIIKKTKINATKQNVENLSCH